MSVLLQESLEGVQLWNLCLKAERQKAFFIIVRNSRSSNGKESDCSAGDLGSIPGLGRSPGEGNGYPLPYSGLENSVQSMGSQELDMT